MNISKTRENGYYNLNNNKRSQKIIRAPRFFMEIASHYLLRNFYDTFSPSPSYFFPDNAISYLRNDTRVYVIFAIVT